MWQTTTRNAPRLWNSPKVGYSLAKWVVRHYASNIFSALGNLILEIRLPQFPASRVTGKPRTENLYAKTTPYFHVHLDFGSVLVQQYGSTAIFDAHLVFQLRELREQHRQSGVLRRRFWNLHGGNAWQNCCCDDWAVVDGKVLLCLYRRRPATGRY